MKLRVRTANLEDFKLMHRWINDPLVRKMSSNEGIIPFDTYQRMFIIILSDQDTLLLIVEANDGYIWLPLAQVRLHTDGTISLSIDSQYRGKGLSAPVILAALEYAKRNFPLENVIARILCENTPSIKAFEKAGFSFNRNTSHKGQPCVEYVYRLTP